MKNRISVIGLGYVGLPIAVTFAERGEDIIGFDISKEKIEQYNEGIDPTKEVGNTRLSQVKNIIFTNDENDLNNSNFFIIAVPTPVRDDKVPDLSPLIGATNLVARHLKKGDYIVFESTVYPGATEEVCVPILEKISGLKFCRDFKVGYSPERINPGDRVHRLETIVKVVSGCDDESLEKIAEIYEIVIDAGVYKASSIKVAEAAKVIENTQRDLNIAFMNELSIIFDKLNIDTLEVLEAAATKWNFLNFRPGLVGGHCIGVDPYYLTYKAQTIGYHPQMILAGRRLNDGMGKVIAERTIKNLIKNGVTIKGSKVLVMGLTFKENCPDLRNSKVIDIINELNDYGVEVLVTDPIANSIEAKREYGVGLVELNKINDVDGVIIAVAHKEYETLLSADYKKLYKTNLDKFTLIDVKSILLRNSYDNKFDIWRL
ncbi:nucleotide sugar dehydrogenase [Liberiplasma polymorphum]|uniref:nucleotide sugar dehydrogenase n=1 Tax=Liberiplasma polymorphum TaxID=3374570 RepID=UPI003775CC19